MSGLSPLRAESGFTLLELLVAMTLAGFLSLVLFGGLHLGRRVWEASETATANADRVREFQTDLTRALQRAYPELISVDATHARIDFAGEADRLTFLTEGGDGSGQMSRITIARDPNSDVIVETIAPELSDRAQARTLTRLRHVASLAFDYFGAAEQGKTPNWFSAWPNKFALPSLVRIRVTFSAPQAHWPGLVVAPRIAADVSCQFDALTKTCVGR